MVSIKSQSLNEIVLNEFVKVGIEDFANTKTNDNHIDEDVSPMSEIAEDQLEGVIHFTAVAETEMKEYKLYLKNNNSYAVLFIVNMSHNKVNIQTLQCLMNQIISK